MRIILLSSLFLLLMGFCGCKKEEGSGNPNGIIKGKIVDDITLMPIQNAQIKIKSSNLVTISDSYGNYIFQNLPSGEYNITAEKDVVSFHKVGYATVKVTGGSESIKDIKIQATKCEVTTIDSIKFTIELWNVVGSIKNPVKYNSFWFTNTPDSILGNIIWSQIQFNGYYEEIRTIHQIDILDNPVIYSIKNPTYRNYYFYPILLTTTGGQAENTYLQCEEIEGYKISGALILSNMTIPVNQIRKIVFIHEVN